MDHNDIIIGSGLSALGVALGLPLDRRVLVLAGRPDTSSQFYESNRAVTCAYDGFGGLGNFWHGVIPTGLRGDSPEVDRAAFAQAAEHFYPGEYLARRLGQSRVFVPWRPIRPAREWPRLAAQRPHLDIRPMAALSFSIRGSGVSVHTGQGIQNAARLWICAGALQTPFLIERSLGARVAREHVSDHVLCYVGQVARKDAGAVPQVERTRHGMWLPVWYDRDERGLYSLRPARFSFARLDHGIERRAVFGLPMASAVAKIFRSASAGLVAEALYNRVGLFAGARLQSVYSQLLVPDAHRLQGEGETPLAMRHDAIRAATDKVRAAVPWQTVTPSRRPEIFIPMIHLHHSIDTAALNAAGVNVPGSAVQVVDASVHERVGPEHHSFKVLVAACSRARDLR